MNPVSLYATATTESLDSQKEKCTEKINNDMEETKGEELDEPDNINNPKERPAFNCTEFWSSPLPRVDFDGLIMSKSYNDKESHNSEGSTTVEVMTNVDNDKENSIVNDSSLAAGPSSNIDDNDSDNDGEGDWITPSNVAKVKARHQGVSGGGAASSTHEEIQVACVTTDFAMQNILLQMNLKLVSIEGMRITKAKSWVLRCHACYKLSLI